MKKTLFVLAIAFIMGGCTSTWEGVKSDSSSIWQDTKKTIHEATE